MEINDGGERNTSYIYFIVMHFCVRSPDDPTHFKYVSFQIAFPCKVNKNTNKNEVILDNLSCNPIDFGD